MATAKALLDTLRVTPPTPFAEQVSSDPRPGRLASSRILFKIWQQRTYMLTHALFCRTS
jgi:hypothetical protein